MNKPRKSRKEMVDRLEAEKLAEQLAAEKQKSRCREIGTSSGTYGFGSSKG